MASLLPHPPTEFWQTNAHVLHASNDQKYNAENKGKKGYWSHMK